MGLDVDKIAAFYELDRAVGAYGQMVHHLTLRVGATKKWVFMTMLTV